MTDVEELPPAAPDTADEPERPRNRRERVLWAVAIASFVVAVVLAVLAATFRSDLVAEREDRRAIERVAGELTTALLTYDYRDLEGWRNRVVRNTTGSFRRTFETTFAQSLEPIVTEVKGSSTGTIKNIFLSDVEDDSATAIVVADTVAKGTAGTRRSFDTYIQLDLVTSGGRWRVNQVTNLNLGEAAGPDGNAPTPTTVQGTNN